MLVIEISWSVCQRTTRPFDNITVYDKGPVFALILVGTHFGLFRVKSLQETEPA